MHTSNLAIRKAANTEFFRSLDGIAKQSLWMGGTDVVKGNELTKYFNWLGELASVKKYIDKKYISSLRAMAMTATADRYYVKYGFDSASFTEDQALIMKTMQAAAAKFANHPNKLFCDFLKAGDGGQSTGGAKSSYPFAGCFDTQTFFSNSHPIYDPETSTTTNDNIVTGTGVDTVAHIQADFESAIQGFLNLKDRAGDPIFEEIRDEYLTIYCAAEDIAIFSQSFNNPKNSDGTLNSYYGRAKVKANSRLNTDTTYDVNGTVGTFSTEDWFVQYSPPDYPFMPLGLYEMESIKPTWDDSKLLDDFKYYYHVDATYGMFYANWQVMQKVYNA